MLISHVSSNVHPTEWQFLMYLDHYEVRPQAWVSELALGLPLLLGV